MAHIEGAIQIREPVERVFDFVADQTNEPRYNRRMSSSKKISPGPIGLGTRFRVMVASGRRPLEMEIEVTEYDRPRRFGSHTVMPAADVTGVLTFQQLGDSTVMKWTWEVQPKGPARFFSPIVTLLGRRQEQEIWTGLKQVLEQGGPGR